MIGGGRMGEALVTGLLGSGGCAADQLRIVEVDPARREVLTAQFPGVEVTEAPGPAAGSVIATKPQYAAQVAAQLSASDGGRMLSIAAGVTIAALEAAAGPGAVVVRAMPNTPALVGMGASAISGGTHATDHDVDWALGLLGSVGLALSVPESALDAVTGLSGSGPAYVFLIAEAMCEAGVAQGLPRDLAAKLTNQTLLGAATLLVDSGDEPAALRAAVTSPGGTTAAGLGALEHAAVRAAFLDAVDAATRRSRELSAP